MTPHHGPSPSPQHRDPLQPFGWFRAVRGNEGLELVAMNPCAFSLLYVIAHRANWRGTFNRAGAGPMQALIGDYKTCGMTQRQYRTAKAQLAKHRFATFKPTSRGTVATLSDTRVFDISGKPSDTLGDRQASGLRPPAVARQTTNKDREELQKGKKERTLSRAFSPSQKTNYSKGF